MMGSSIPEDPKLQAQLAARWQEYRDLSRFDRPDEPGAWNLLYSLHGIEQSCRALLDRQMPALVDATDGEQLQAALTDIGDELSHLLYHVRDARYFDYLSFGEQ